MKKHLLILFSVILFCSWSAEAQFLWYENESNTANINFVNGLQGTFTTNQTNPNTGGLNSNILASKFVRNGANTPQILFDLPYPITNLSGLTIGLKAYIGQATASLTTTNKRVRVYLRNNSQGAVGQLFLSDDMVNGEEWEQKSFNFDGIAIPQNIIDAGGFDRMAILLAAGDTAGETTTYYFDTVGATVSQEAPIIVDAELDAGNSWYHNYSPDTFNATTGQVLEGTFLMDQTSPNTTENGSTLVSKFTKAVGTNAFIQFSLPGNLTDMSKALFKIRVYTETDPLNPTTTNNNVALFLRKGAIGTGQLVLRADVTEFNKWIDYTFDFTGFNFPAGISDYDQIWLAFAQPDSDSDAEDNVYHFDAFQGPFLIPLSVDENILAKNYLRLYPTKVLDKFKTSKKVLSAEVYNLMGQKVITYGSQKEFIASQLTSGLYIFKATLEGGVSQTLRFVKQ